MSHSRKLNNKINRIHEKALRIVYSDYVSTFDELLEISSNVTIHAQNIRSLMIEMFRVKNNIAPQLLKDIFQLSPATSYFLREHKDFIIRKVNTVKYGLSSLTYIGLKLWNKLPLEVREIKSLSEFKTKIKTWKSKTCDCRL